MVSFDVVSLFTCIPLELARETIGNLLDNFDLNLPPTATIEMLEYFLSNYFQFGNRNCHQIKGMSMGSPISGLFAEAVLQRLERKTWFPLSINYSTPRYLG